MDSTFARGDQMAAGDAIQVTEVAVKGREAVHTLAGMHRIWAKYGMEARRADQWAWSQLSPTPASTVAQSGYSIVAVLMIRTTFPLPGVSMMV